LHHYLVLLGLQGLGATGAKKEIEAIKAYKVPRENQELKGHRASLVKVLLLID
jgi:hypothetical protein